MSSTMDKRNTLKDKAYHLWKVARLPKYLNKYGPKRTPGWVTYLSYLEYITHASAWRRAANFMFDYYSKARHWTSWQKAISKWPMWVWNALSRASAGTDFCEKAAIDGTTMARSNPSQHYLHRIDREETVARPIQEVIMVDIAKWKFLSWRVRIKPRGEKCDVRHLVMKSPTKPELIIMDKGFDSNPLHTWLRNNGIWSIAPVRKGCRRGNYRKQLRDCFDWALYWERNIVECMISAVKRLFGAFVKARTAKMQRAEIFTKFIAYNLGAYCLRLSTEP